MIAAILLALRLVSGAEAAVPDGASHGWVALGAMPFYGYDERVEGGWMARLDASWRRGRWFAEADLQLLGVGSDHLSGLELVQGGWLLVARPRFPDLWLTAGAFQAGSIQADVPGNRDRLGPTAGFHCILPLAGLDRGEIRFSMAFSPTAGALLKAMDVGWNFGPVGLRAGGVGLRTGYGRLYSAFTVEACHRW